MHHLEAAIEIVGTQTALAKMLGVAPQVVHNWLTRGRVPADYCPGIERATGGAVRCEQLRPDVDWNYLRGTKHLDPITCGSADPRHTDDRRHPPCGGRRESNHKKAA